MEKQTRYLKEDGTDLIDKWSTEYSPERFRWVMWAMIEKYQSRLGLKNPIHEEVRKMADYANRWAEQEEALARKEVDGRN